MRNPSFRVWFPKENRWLHGYTPGRDDMSCHLVGECMLMGEWLREVGIEDYNDIVIEQSSEVEDKNGIEIYEGDLITPEVGGVVFAVAFENGAFVARCNDPDVPKERAYAGLVGRKHLGAWDIVGTIHIEYHKEV